MKRQIFGGVLLGLWTIAAFSQAPQPLDPGPVQAELLANLDVRHLQIGKTVFARVTSDWAEQQCALRKGATLEGKVEESVPRAGKAESKLALSFKQAQCSGRDMRPMDLVLTVIARAPDVRDNAPNTQNMMTMSIPPGLVSGPTQGGGPGVVSTPSPALGNFRMAQQTMGQLQMSRTDHRFPVRKNIVPGDVLDLKGLALGIGTGPNQSSVISSKVRDVFLAEFTQMLLVPPAHAFRTSPMRLAANGLAESPAGDASVKVASVPPPTIPPPNDIEVCAPPGCVADLPVSTTELEGREASSIPTRPLGYIPRTNKALAGLGDEESLVWVGPGQLLFTFNPHRLIRRSQASNDRNTQRVIRAVLLDPATRKVIRAVDWEITDARRYLWPLDQDRILVHVGNELRVYGAGLEMERSIPLAGPLAFVRIAPNGSLAAIATLRERHSPELHTKLRSEIGIDPEEDVDVSILNKNFDTLAQASTVSGLMPPTLLNEGQVRLQAEPSQWYRLAMTTWENKKVPLARFQSLCTPQVSSAAPDLVFLVTCSSNNGSLDYRMLRSDGKVLMRGTSEPLETGHEATGNHSSRRFAVKVVHSERSITAGTTFKSSDLDSELVRVYRADDGKRLLAVQVKDPVASHGGYALSPDGSQLAVLSGSEIQFFPVPSD
jgi:hypothetical protein